MAIGEALRTTLVEVWSHKLRSLLTLVGVVLGTMAVVTMVSLIDAVKVTVWSGLESLGLRGVLFVSAARPQSELEVQRLHLSGGLTAEDAVRLVEGSDQVAAAAPTGVSQQLIAWGDRSRTVRVTGTVPSYAEVLNRGVARGRFLVDLDLERQHRVVVLGKLLAEDLFGSSDPVGQRLRIGSTRFEVVGVGERIGNDMVNDGWSRREMLGATIPLTTLQSVFGGGERVPVVVVKAASTERLDALYDHLENMLWRRHNRVEDFEVENVAAEILEAEQQVDEMLSSWTVVLFSISAISLVVGGVGIFSVMQISLAERLYEIGLRKAIGAEDRDVLLQFLVEAVFLSIVGAGLGLLLAVGLCAAVGPNFEAGLPVSSFAIMLAVAFAIGVGLVAGLYPSVRAARLTPVEALRG